MRLEYKTVTDFTIVKHLFQNQLMLLREVARMEVDRFKANPQPILILHRYS